MQKHQRFWALAAPAAALATLVLIAGPTAGASTPTPSGSDPELAAMQRSLVSQAAGSLALVAGDTSTSSVVGQEGPEREPIERATPTPTTAPNATTPARNVSAAESPAAGARPGWGCGDTHHTHSGPPGRPNASAPPGCAKH